MKDQKNDEKRCPLSGNPCNLHKQIHITEQRPDGSVKEMNLCNMCGGQHLAKLDGSKVPLTQVEDQGTPIPVNTGKSPVSHSSPHTKMIHEFIQFVLNPPENFQPKKWRKSACPECGWTIEDIRRTAKLGCHACWIWYKNELNLIIKNAHVGGVKHVGKVPKAWKARQEAAKLEAEKQAETKLPPDGQLRRLERKMKEAVKKERYEDAAVIRDAIKALKETEL